MLPLALVTGFGAFEKVAENPSGLLARGLHASPPTGWRVVGAELPVSFQRAPEAFERFFDEEVDGEPALFVPMGVHKEPGFRLERWARGAPQGKPGRRDNDGLELADVERGGPDLASALPLDALASELGRRSGEDCFVSEDAGGYVCERVYHRVLTRAGAAPAVFLHVPPLRFTPLERQMAVVHQLFALVAEGLDGASS